MSEMVEKTISESIGNQPTILNKVNYVMFIKFMQLKMIVTAQFFEVIYSIT